MKGIVGKKLGMTQLFDEETGEVTPVTVIEAGPCPIVRVKTVDSDGYEAVQLAFDQIAERKVTKPRLGQLGERRAAPQARRVPRHDRAHRRRAGHGRELRARRPDQGLRDRDRQGLRGHDQAAQLPPRPRLARLAQRPRPGSIGASATPSRVFKGIKMAGRMGGKRVTQVGLTVHDVDAERNLLLVKGAVPGPKNGYVEVREDTGRGRA